MSARRVMHALTAGEYSDFSVCALFERREDAEAAMHAGAGDYVAEYPLYGPEDLPKQVTVHYGNAVLGPAGMAHMDKEPWFHMRVVWDFASPTGALFNATALTDKHGWLRFHAEGTDSAAVVKSVSDRYAKALAERAGL